MKKLTLKLCWVLAALLVAIAVRGQEPVGVIRVQVRLVEVYASVYDHKGQYVEGLGRDNFRVFEDGKQQQITGFEADTAKLSCAILLDTTGSMGEALPRVKNSVMKMRMPRSHAPKKRAYPSMRLPREKQHTPRS